MTNLNNPAFGTPTLVVTDNRALPVRTLYYNRSTATDPLDERIERTVFGPAGFAVSRIDPRLFATGLAPNFESVHALSGRVLRTASVDAGTTLSLHDVEDRVYWQHDACGTVTTRNYDPLGRVLTVQEQAVSEAATATRDAFFYGEAEVHPEDNNLRGQCVRHYDTVGRLSSASFSLAGQALCQSSQLLANAEHDADWAGQDEQAWQDLLDASVYMTRWDYDAVDQWLTQTDAAGHQQHRCYDVAGRLTKHSLMLAGGANQTLLSAINYNAAGQVLSEQAGNGMLTAYEYEPQTQRRVRIATARLAQNSRATLLQDLRYTYDPVGNVLNVCDNAQSSSFWRNQKVEPQQTYTYDALYQLVSATGRETASRSQQGTQLPSALVPLVTDDSIYTGYTRHYRYDRAGNLTQIGHSAPATSNSYTVDITVSNRSNRAVLARHGLTPDQVDTLFDAAGHQCTLMPGQALDWDHRGALCQVTPVRRDSGQDDREWYRYDSGGMRVLKVNEQQSANTIQVRRVLYLPGLECRTTYTGGTETENVQLIRLQITGQLSVRVMHWTTAPPSGMTNNQVRYSVDDLIGSSVLELDAAGELCSREEYYPFGGTAVWTARSAVEADYKSVRYSNKERDATGLYYYGYRYYQPWVARWLSVDPAGTIDGLNLYRMVRNNPVGLSDPNGRAPVNRNSNMPGDTRISDIAMLGSHDAGTYKYNDGLTSIGSWLKGLFRTQELSLVEQAQAGVQYFDIRPATKSFSRYQYAFFHGLSNTPGDALSEIYALLDHAAQDSGSLYILKFHFKEEDAVDAKNVFLSRVTDRYADRLITPAHFSNRTLGDVTVGESVHTGRNIAVLTKEAQGVHENIKDFVWDYSSSVHTKWGNTLSGKSMASHIANFGQTAPNGKIVITQTNMPGISIKKPPFISRGLKHLASKNHGIVANAVESLVTSGNNPGIISIDFVGSASSSSTERYNFLAEVRNGVIANRYSGRRSSI